MKVATIGALFFSGLAVCASLDVLDPRSTQSILAAIKTIKSDIKTLNSSVASFTGSPTQALTIQMQTTQLGDDVQSGTKTANASAKLNNAGSGKVGTAILELEPDIFSLLKNIIAKKPEFEKVLSVPLVEMDLEQQKSDTDAFGAAIAAKLTKSYASLAPGIQKKIDAHFTKAIKAYSSGL